MTWEEFRNLTSEIPDDEEVVLGYYDETGKHKEICIYREFSVDKDETENNFFNDNTIILKET